MLPFEGSSSSRCPTGVTAGKAASREVRRLPECCLRRAGGVIGFSTPASPSPFPAEPAVFLPSPSPVPLRDRVHPLVGFRPLQSPRVPFSSRRLSAPEHLPWGCGSLFATWARGIVTSGFQPRRLPSSAFLTPSTVSSATGFVGLFHPTATSRVHPSGVFPPRTAVTSSSLARALSSVGSGPLPVLPPAPGSVAPPSGLFSVRRVRCLRVGVTRREGPFPSWASPSSRCSLSLPPKARNCFRPLLALRERPSSRPFA